MTPDDTPHEGEFSKLIDEQLELAAAKIPALEPAAVHPSPVDHEERKAAHANFEDVLLGNAQPSPEMLEELAALEAALGAGAVEGLAPFRAAPGEHRGRRGPTGEAVE